MFVEKTIKDNQAFVKINGRIDVETSPKLRKELAEINYGGLKNFTLDFDNVSYISSAGLRELMIVSKKLGKDVPFKILNVNDVVAEVFDMTQFTKYVEYTLSEKEIDYTRMSFKELLAYKVKLGSKNTIISYSGKKYDWNDIEKYSQIIAEDLSKQGVKKGSHVALCGMNSANWVFTFYAIQKLGAIAQLLSFSLPLEEISKFAKAGDITHFCYGEMPLVTDEENFIKAITSNDSSIKNVYSIKNSVDFSQRVNEYEKLIGKFENKIEADDPCVMIFTSGSTGMPKGVLLSAFNMLNSSCLIRESVRITKEDKACLILPLFHIFGLVANLFPNNIADAETIILDNIKTANIIKVISENKCTLFNSVPTMLLSIINNKDFLPEKLSTLRSTISAGAPISEAQMTMLSELLPNNHFTSSYGLSEMAPISISDYDDTKEHITKTIGKPMKNVQIRIFDKEKNQVCPVGESGEIQVQGYNLMTCYYKAPLDDQSIDDEGWLHTGDLGYFDEEGYIHFVGRSKELIIRGGENIIPNEVISAISQEDYIADAKVFGVPDDFWGETVAAAIVMKEGFTFDEEKLRESLKTRLAKYKIPAHFFVYDAFPSLPNGKVDNVNLKKEVIQKAKELEVKR